MPTVRTCLTNLLLMVAPIAAAAQDTPDEAAVRTVVERYLHGLKFNDVENLRQAFWPGAKLFFVKQDGTLGQLTQADWYQGFSGSAGKEERGYTDDFSLLKLGGRWWIVNKIYTAEKR